MVSGYPAAALAGVADRLHGCGGLWVVGGSTGLILRGADLGREPRDLDIYADEEDMLTVHDRLASDALDIPAASETERYRSILSHYSVEGTLVELVGAFRIASAASLYRTEVRELLYPLGETFVVDGREIRIVPLGHELLFNVLRERTDRCELIGELIRQEPQRHLPVLHTLLERNVIAPRTAEQAMRFAV